MKQIILAVFISVVGAYAAEHTKKVDLGELRKELIAGGCSVDGLRTHGDKIYLPDCDEAAAIIAAHDAMSEPNRKADIKARLKVLRTKANGVGLSDAERDEAIAKMITTQIGR